MGTSALSMCCRPATAYCSGTRCPILLLRGCCLCHGAPIMHRAVSETEHCRGPIKIPEEIPEKATGCHSNICMRP